MSSDENLGLTESELNIDEGDGGSALQLQAAPTRSLSGHERNHFFLNQAGKGFTDISAIAGLDDPSDGRVFAILDFDRDGWQDIAVVNANAPLLQLHRNRVGELAAAQASGHLIALRFVGGNLTSSPSEQWSSRDGYGAMATVVLDDMTLVRELRAGDGMAAQNSATLVIGIGTNESAQKVQVRWPSGKSQEIENVAAGTLLTLYENSEHSVSGRPFTAEPYFVPIERTQNQRIGRGPFDDLILAPLTSEEVLPELFMYTTMATWCAVCKSELPHMETLRSAFGSDELKMVGVPTDEEEGPRLLRNYREQYDPAYDLQVDLSLQDRSRVKQMALDALGLEALPSTIVTDADGRVLDIRLGVPTVSDLRILLERIRGESNGS